MNQIKFIILFTLLILGTYVSSARAQVATDSSYSLDQSVIAGGGGTSVDAGNRFSITGSIGQSVTDTSSAATFVIRSGFFTAAAPLAPTAALVTVSGRAMTSTGRGIRNVMVRMTDGSGATRTAVSTSFGYYRFTNVPAGETYIFTVKGKRFEFAHSTQVLNIGEDTNEINFIANSQ